MLLLRLAGPAAVFCGGLVLGAGFAALTDGAASARSNAPVAIRAVGTRAVPGVAAHAARRQAIALRVIGLPMDGTKVPVRLVPPSLRSLFEAPDATYASAVTDTPARLRPLRGHGARRALGRA